MAATVADILKVMEEFAPSRLAEEWDNAGLQVGEETWPVRSVWVALDPSVEVVAAACGKGVDLLITHHPLIFQPLRSVDVATPVGAVIQMALEHKTAIFSAHTNLDKAADGLNDVLSSRIGLRNPTVLGGIVEPETYKLVVFVPVGYEQKILEALFETVAGEIGAYTGCSFRSAGIGTFRPGPSAKPFTGKAGEVSHADEVRIETLVFQKDLDHVIEQVRKHHPYETMAYDVYRILASDRRQGFGRVGELETATDLSAFSQQIKRVFELGSVKVVGRPDLPVRQVAVCAGSGSSLMNAFLSSGADVFVSGDLRYHDARAAEAAGVGLIDIGHFASERFMIEMVSERLRKSFSETGTDVAVQTCPLEKDPFVIL